jgi:hypothetical protein
VTERDVLPVDVGRVRRVNTQRRHSPCRAIKGAGARGCSVPAPHTDGQHVRHSYDGGRTELRNLVHR